MRAWTGPIVAVAFVLALVTGSPSTTAAQDKDTLVIALDTLGAMVMDPIADTRAPHAHYHAPIWDSLVGFDLEKGGIGPGVAERWERAADGRSWTFHLRKGLKFHNGDPVTAHDVKFSLERKMSPESIASGAAALRRAVQSIEVMDEHTVRVYTKGVIPHFAASLSRAVFMEGSVMPKKYIETGAAPRSSRSCTCSSCRSRARVSPWCARARPASQASGPRRSRKPKRVA
jgi:peptide/nickel transport system substrate-binding protein